MNNIDLNEIKEYILESGKEYRRNILLYIQWVLDDYDNRKSIHSSELSNAFDDIYPFYIEGIKTLKEWNRINQRGQNDFILEHKSLQQSKYKSGWMISLKLSKDETEKLFQETQAYKPSEVQIWQYEMPGESDYLRAIEKYNVSDWTKSKNKIQINGNEYQLKALSSIAIGLKNNLDGPANFYMYTTNELKKHLRANCPNFKIIDNSKTNENDDEDEESADITSKGKDKSMPSNKPLNQILYGPPGTGKTYHTIDKALEILLEKQPDQDITTLLLKAKTDDLIPNEREKLKFKFDEFRKSGQIDFVTFHQSYGYEEFVEGVKALEPDHEENQTDELLYRTMPGIFKKLTTKAQSFDTENEFGIGINTKVWKISLEGARENPTKTYCFENDIIRIGWDNYGDLNNSVEPLNTSLKYFYNAMSEGDFVISLFDAKHIDGIGIITGDYFYDANLGEYCHCRKVKWLVKNKKMYFYDINDKRNLVQSTIYRLWHVNKNLLLELIASEDTTFSTIKNEKNYVLIIDEINRGNISKIFGELITLIEPSKRIGEPEEINVKLPYSSEEFGVPSNLYIIGTMNTADRSIAPIDTALRRRFVFEEMEPKPELLSEYIDGVNLQKLLTAINARIEYLYDRDHTIGHAYLIDVESLLDLEFAFKNKIIPLLAEYFYEDWENIDLVLNSNGFILESKESSAYISKITSKINGKKSYKVMDSKWTKKHFQKIYDDSIEINDLSGTLEDDESTDEQSNH